MRGTMSEYVYVVQAGDVYEGISLYSVHHDETGAIAAAYEIMSSPYNRLRHYEKEIHTDSPTCLHYWAAELDVVMIDRMKVQL